MSEVPLRRDARWVGFSADRDVVTWIVRQEDGGWLISGWWLGAAKDYKY